jgi:hypothetical protein
VEIHALDELLATLKKHGVSEYSHDQYGTKVRFEAQPLRFLAPEEPEETTAFIPPHLAKDGPPPSKTREIERLPLDDLLPAGGA